MNGTAQQGSIKDQVLMSVAGFFLGCLVMIIGFITDGWEPPAKQSSNQSSVTRPARVPDEGMTGICIPEAGTGKAFTAGKGD